MFIYDLATKNNNKETFWGEVNWLHYSLFEGLSEKLHEEWLADATILSQRETH